MAIFKLMRTLLKLSGQPSTFTTSKNELSDLQYPLTMVPFHGPIVPVIIRELNDIQIKSCGDFSLIETIDDKIRMKKKPTMKDMARFAKVQTEICKLALVKPTFDEIMEIYDKDKLLAKMKSKFSELREKLHNTPGGPQRKELELEIDRAEILANITLPADFLGTITAYSLGIDKSDIKKITKEILIDAAILATNGHNNPSDHIEGMFTPFMTNDINRRAWTAFREWKESEQKSGQRKRKSALKIGA